MSTGSGGSGGECANCGVRAAGEKRLMKCGRCREAHYCSKECQTKHWNIHRKMCDESTQESIMVGGTNRL